MNVARGRTRRALTLMELLVAMVSATLLMAMLASTIRVANRTLDESVSDLSTDEDEKLAQRIRDDLEFAAEVNLSTGYSAVLTRPTLTGSGSQPVTYGQSYTPGASGLFRQTDAESAELIQPGTTVAFQGLDGYSGPTVVSRPSTVHIRAFGKENQRDTESMAIAVPHGTQASDWLILFVASRHGKETTVDNAGWQQVRSDQDGNLYLCTYIRSPANDFADVQLSNDEKADIAAVILAMDIEQTTWPILASGGEVGDSDDSDAGTWSAPISLPTVRQRDLNLQAFVADGDPWHELTLGVPGFTDVERELTHSVGGNDGCSVAILARTGPLPSISAPIRVGEQDNGDWITQGFVIGGDAW